MPSFSWSDDGYVSSEDKSSVPCLWKDCRRPIHPSDLYCSKGCRNKAKAYQGKGHLHHEGAKKHAPNSFYMNMARVVDQGIPGLVQRPENVKLQTHKRAWESAYQFMKPQQGPGPKFRGKNGF